MAAVLVGRTGELALVSAFAQRARIDGEALLVFGEPGVGKTALLDAAAEEASGSGTRAITGPGERQAGAPVPRQRQAGAPGHLTAR